jgi:hypothetical protein
MVSTSAKKDEKPLHAAVLQWLSQHQYEPVPPERFEAAKILGQPIYARELPLGKGIYGTDLACDFAISHPDASEGDVLVECHWQETSGSTDEKYPYFVKNIENRYPPSVRVIILLGGGGYRPGALAWLRSQVGDKLRHVATMDDLHIALKKEKL